MSIYFVSFSLKSGPTYQARYDNLMNMLKELSPGIWWEKTTSFILLSSDLTEAAIAAKIKLKINERTDTVVLGMTEFKTMLVIGVNGDDDIYKLVPFAKPA